jgi:hypothetical protein
MLSRASVVILLFVSLSLSSAAPVHAQQAAASPPAAVQGPDDVARVSEELARLRREFDQLRRLYDERLLALEQRLGQITSGPAVVAASEPPASTPASLPEAIVAPQAEPAQAPVASGKVFNPDTSVIANFMGAAGRNPFGASRAMELSEAEVSFQAIVDQTAKADFFLAASPEGLEVEEGYITFTSLPADLLLKVGKMRAQFGKVNTQHTHAMPTVDRPLVTQNLVGGEEGLSDSGLSFSHLIQNPLLFLEVTGELYAGSGDVFQATERKKLTYLGRLRAFKDITEDMNIDLGASYAMGSTDLGESLQPAACGVSIDDCSLGKKLVGVDATFRYRPLRRAIYHRLNLRTELIWSRQGLPGDTTSKAFGFYGLGEYQFARRWYAGARVDRSARVLDRALTDTGGAFFVTFWPSEFSQLRGQYRRINFAEGVRANEFLFQFNFSIGAHGAHLF